ncbi:vanadium-dependent haloperoxidase [Methylovulum psychrotolerans]|uniref:Phosphatase PAP2 family protein n=1 Tax=Methylovulum psychrotolerans TaxID=1704499 RepID=A0A2S5CME8_9GAMM|nr:vanadium-dependent haloperoxidase [Methylovulum psychrotolerans]POZ51948.1 phosphatase PAP2 family protein [Methylovulum psychrotolerans]
MKNNTATPLRLTTLTVAIAASLFTVSATADTVTDWNKYTVWATKAATSLTTGTASLAQNSNVATRIEAIEARAVFDAVNVFDHFNPTSYYYNAAAPTGATAKSAAAAAAQAAHDVLLGALPNPASGSWNPTRDWLNTQLASDLAALGVTAADPGIAVGQAAAAAALAARAEDFSAIRTTYTPSSNLSVSTTNTVIPNATGNPGIGLWRPSNGAAGVNDPITGAPTGFDASGAIQAAAGIDFNWKNVTPFSLTTVKKQLLVATVPPALTIGSDEYNAELDFVKTHGQDSANPGNRSHDQTLQALFYKSDAELFVNEAARLASASRNLTLDQNAKLFAVLANALADARIAAFQSKYDLTFWRPITALNANPDGSVSTYTWKPLATTPSHPSNTGGHSATGAAGAEILRAFFKSDNIQKNGTPVTLTTLPWLIGTNNGTGQVDPLVFGGDATTRTVSSFSKLQLENGRSRIYLGVHFGNDDYQGQTLGLTVADAIINTKTDPAAAGLSVFWGNANTPNNKYLKAILTANSATSGFFGL